MGDIISSNIRFEKYENVQFIKSILLFCVLFALFVDDDVVVVVVAASK